MIQTVVVVQLVEGRVDADGPNRFASMVPYAKDTGRVDETTSSLQAHVEWT